MMRASSWLRAWQIDISRDGFNSLKARFLGSIASFSSNSSEGGGGGGSGGNSNTPSVKPGSAEDLLNFLQIHRKEWNRRPSYPKKSRRDTTNDPRASSFSRNRRDDQRQRQRQREVHPSSSYQSKQQRSNQRTKQQQQTQNNYKNQPKSATALGLSQSRRSREITNRVVAAFANADAQLRSQDLSIEDKLDAARRCILSFTRLSSFPLSDINISAIMHKVCRLVTHRSLGETRTGSAAGAAYPDLDHVPLMEKLLDNVISRAKLQLILTQPQQEEEEIILQATTTTSSPASPVSLAAFAPRATAAPSNVNGKIHDSTAALTLYSCGTIGMHLPQPEIDILSSILLTFQPMWTEQRVIMVLLALARLGIHHGELPPNSPTSALLDALYTTAEERLEKFSAEELSTLVWALASVDYQDIKSDFLTQLMASLLLKVDDLPIVGVFSTLEGLMMHDWVPPAPKDAWIEVHTINTNFAEEESYTRRSSTSGYSSGNGGREGALYEDAEGRFQVKDLRELQSLAKAWEQQRRSGLAELLASNSSSTSSLMESESSQQENNKKYGALNNLNLGALAQSAMRARAERTNKAQLKDVAAQIARELRASAAAAASAATTSNDGDTLVLDSPPFSTATSSSEEYKLVLKPSEEDDALVLRLLTGQEWIGEGEEEEELRLERTLGLQQYQQELQKSSGVDVGGSSGGVGGGRGRRRIFRLGPLLAEASINPSSGREIIQPHYERAHLWDPLLLHPSQQREQQEQQQQQQELTDIVGETLLLESDFVNLDLGDLSSSSSSSLDSSLDSLESDLLLNESRKKEAEEEIDVEIDPESTIDEMSEAAAAAVAALAQRVTSLIPAARPDQVVSFARYFSALRHYDRDLLIAVRDKIQHVLENYNPNSTDNDGEKNTTATATTSTNTHSTSIRAITFADFLWSFASLGITDILSPELCRKAIHAALHDRDASAVALSRAAWSLAVLGHLDAPTFKNICARIVSSTINSRSNSLEEQEGSHDNNDNTVKVTNQVVLKQVFQAALQVEISTGESHETLLPPALRTTAADAWNDRRNFLSTSYLQRQVAGVLKNNLGLDCELEHAPEGSFVVIDIAVFDKNNTNNSNFSNYTTSGSSVAKVAVEVDGPYHFATNKITHALGAMQLRDSLLRHSGWEVVSIPYFEWMDVKHWERAKYLEGKVMPVLQRQQWR